MDSSRTHRSIVTNTYNAVTPVQITHNAAYTHRCDIGFRHVPSCEVPGRKQLLLGNITLPAQDYEVNGHTTYTNF